ncbi:MAG TPA: hypothetical protein VMZ53_04885 [Kofleriaceae bacterium]|nr:hypothetical protein [Kofleriaceae bacterium]
MRAWIALLLIAGCGAAPNQPVLANAPRPNPAAVAGVAAGAAAAITLADPDAATRGPEKKKESTDMKGQKVKENVPAAVLDRADHQNDAKQPKRDPANPAASPEQPKGALDFGSP